MRILAKTATLYQTAQTLNDLKLKNISNSANQFFPQLFSDPNSKPLCLHKIATITNGAIKCNSYILMSFSTALPLSAIENFHLNVKWFLTIAREFLFAADHHNCVLSKILFILHTKVKARTADAFKRGKKWKTLLFVAFWPIFFPILYTESLPVKIIYLENLMLAPMDCAMKMVA